jgi:hypothetical protein
MRVTQQAHRAQAFGYCNQCGITDNAVKKQIFDFSDGIFDLGLWNNFVCWPLRSSQNRGTGTTVFSLGGLGTFNGTAVGGPAWTADGMSFDGVNDYVTTALRITELSTVEFAIVSVFNLAADSGTFAHVFGQDTSGVTGSAGSFRRNQTFSTINFGITIDSSARDNFAGAVGVTNIHSGRVVQNTGTFHAVGSGVESLAAFSGTYNAVSNDFVGFGARHKESTPSNYAKMTNSFGAVIKGFISSQSLAGVRDLYKSTLGQGLGLP